MSALGVALRWGKKSSRGGDRLNDREPDRCTPSAPNFGRVPTRCFMPSFAMATGASLRELQAITAGLTQDYGSRASGAQPHRPTANPAVA